MSDHQVGELVLVLIGMAFFGFLMRDKPCPRCGVKARVIGDSFDRFCNNCKFMF